MVFKKVFFLFFILFFFFCCSQTFDGGFKGGIVGSEVFGDRLGGLDKAGFFLGLFARLPLQEKWAIQTEMMYVQKGSRKNPKPENNFTKYLLRLNYIEMPFMVIYKNNKNIHLEIGLAFGVLTKVSNNEWDENGLMSGQKPFRPYELSGNIGMYYIINKNISANIRISNSLLPIRKYDSVAPLWLSRFSFLRGQYSTAVLLGIIYNVYGRRSIES